MERDNELIDPQDLRGQSHALGRRRKWFFLFPLAALIIGTLLILSIWAVFGEEAAGSIVAPYALITCFTFGLLGWRLISSRCPRCGDTFFFRTAYANPFATRCLHCKLPLSPAT
jgi:hypothetical protein